jgi:hypothetical protein
MGIGGLWPAALIAGLIGGAAAGLIGEWSYAFFKPVLVSTVINGREGLNATIQTINVATVQNAMLTFALLGAVLGVVLGMGGGLARRSVPAAVIAAAVGLIAGGVAGVAAAARSCPRRSIRTIMPRTTFCGRSSSTPRSGCHWVSRPDWPSAWERDAEAWRS